MKLIIFSSLPLRQLGIRAGGLVKVADDQAQAAQPGSSHEPHLAAFIFPDGQETNRPGGPS